LPGQALLAAMLSPAPRVVLCGGEERGTWLREVGAAAGATFAYALALERPAEGDAQRDLQKGMQRGMQRGTGVPPVDGGEAAATSTQTHGRDARAPLESVFFDPYQETEIHERNLPHWHQNEAWVFVTWHLADSLPLEKLRAWMTEKEAWWRIHPKPWDEATAREFHTRFSARMEGWLDAGEGACVLRRPEIRGILADALGHFDGQRYELGDYVIMPNHAHVLFRAKAGHDLAEILHSWKSFTAKAVNRALGTSGTVWQEEYWDRLIRHERHLAACQRYIAENPLRARLPSGSFTHRSMQKDVQRGMQRDIQRDQQRGTGVSPVGLEQRCGGFAAVHGQDARAPLQTPLLAPLQAPALGRVTLAPADGPAAGLAPAEWFALLHGRKNFDGIAAPGWRLRLTWADA
jgi:type I restriction enzyme R subunit